MGVIRLYEEGKTLITVLTRAILKTTCVYAVVKSPQTMGLLTNLKFSMRIYFC